MKINFTEKLYKKEKQQAPIQCGVCCFSCYLLLHFVRFHSRLASSDWHKSGIRFKWIGYTSGSRKMWNRNRYRCAAWWHNCGTQQCAIESRIVYIDHITGIQPYYSNCVCNIKIVTCVWYFATVPVARVLLYLNCSTLFT